MQKWEYKVVSTTGSASSSSDYETAFKSLGEEGWELATVCVQGGSQFAYFKRLKTGSEG